MPQPTRDLLEQAATTGAEILINAHRGDTDVVITFG